MAMRSTSKSGRGGHGRRNSSPTKFAPAKRVTASAYIHHDRHWYSRDAEPLASQHGLIMYNNNRWQSMDDVRYTNPCSYNQNGVEALYPIEESGPTMPTANEDIMPTSTGDDDLSTYRQSHPDVALSCTYKGKQVAIDHNATWTDDIGLWVLRGDAIDYAYHLSELTALDRIADLSAMRVYLPNLPRSKMIKNSEEAEICGLNYDKGQNLWYIPRYFGNKKGRFDLYLKHGKKKDVATTARATPAPNTATALALVPAAAPTPAPAGGRSLSSPSSSLRPTQRVCLRSDSSHSA